MTDNDAREAPLNWGPDGPPAKPELVDSWTPGRSTAHSWGPYHDVLFPVRKTSPWITFKIMTTGVNVAQRLWNEREALRTEYEAAHGFNPERWPTRHPGIVLESVESVAHAACLGCHWLRHEGTSMGADDWRNTAVGHATEHQNGGSRP